MTGPLKTMTEAAAWLGIHPKTLAELVAAERVPFTRLPSTAPTGGLSTRNVRFSDEHLAAIVAAGEQPARSAA